MGCANRPSTADFSIAITLTIAHTGTQYYAIKQVAPVVVEAQNEIVVVTVFTYYF